MDSDALSLQHVLDVAIRAAQRAGSHMRQNLLKAKIDKQKDTKDDLVTVVDKLCQDVINNTVLDAFPTHEMLGEEDVPPGRDESIKAIAQAAGVEALWIVDPIDGTTNFVHHRPASVVSIAFATKGQVAVAVIYDPYRDELFSAIKGQGANLNGNRIHVSVKETQFSEALIGFGIGTKQSVRDPMLRCVARFSEKCRAIRLQGSAAIELAWLAAGRQTCFYELDLNAWDVAAGFLIITEAGGKVTDSFGQPFSLLTRHLVASTGIPIIHQQLLLCIQEANAQDIEKFSS